MDDEGDAYRLKWQTHVPSLCTEFMELRKNESYVDVTLICRGGEIKAHRLILSSCSPLLERLLSANQESEATLILPDLQVACVRSLIEYVYTGEISVQDCEIGGLVEAATVLQVRGIATMSAPPLPPQRPTSLPLPLPFLFAPPPHMTSPLNMTSPVKSLLRRAMTSPMTSPGRPSPAKRRRSSGEDEAERRRSEAEKRREAERRRNSPQKTAAARCSSPLFVETDGDVTDAARRCSDSASADGSEPQTSHVTTTSQDDCVTSQMASTSQDSPDCEPSDAETSLLNPQIELSEGEGRVRVKSEDMTSPMMSPMTSPPDADAPGGSCVFCKKHFVSAGDLRDHISRVHVSDRLEKQFKCDYCPAAFARSAHLKRHVRTHTGERPYACHVCPRAFSRQDKLKCHMDRHTEEERRKAQTPDGSALPSPTSSMQSYLRSLNPTGLALLSPPSPSASGTELNCRIQTAATSGGSGSGQTPTAAAVAAAAAAANPGLPYLQHILDDVQIVRDKRPASYYRGGKRMPASSAAAADSLLGAVRRLGETSVKLATTAE